MESANLLHVQEDFRWQDYNKNEMYAHQKSVDEQGIQDGFIGIEILLQAGLPRSRWIQRSVSVAPWRSQMQGNGSPDSFPFQRVHETRKELLEAIVSITSDPKLYDLQ
jgi:hypothetical protein